MLFCAERAERPVSGLKENSDGVIDLVVEHLISAGVVALVASNVHWRWTPSPCIPAGVGAVGVGGEVSGRNVAGSPVPLDEVPGKPRSYLVNAAQNSPWFVRAPYGQPVLNRQNRSRFVAALLLVLRVLPLAHQFLGLWIAVDNPRQSKSVPAA